MRPPSTSNAGPVFGLYISHVVGNSPRAGRIDRTWVNNRDCPFFAEADGHKKGFL